MPAKKKADFDSWADDYSKILDNSVAASGENSIFFIELKMKLLRNFLKGMGIANAHIRILDFGCGTGRAAEFIRKYFPNSDFLGVDPSKASIAVASKKYPMYSFNVLNLRKGMRFRKKFDVIFAANVFHHISAGLRRHAMEQICEALKPGGLFFLFEHNPYNPLVVRIVRECPFDKGVILIKPAHARKLFSSAHLKVERQTYYFFFPRSFSFLRWSERFMGYIPFGAQYMLVGRKR